MIEADRHGEEPGHSAARTKAWRPAARPSPSAAALAPAAALAQTVAAERDAAAIKRAAAAAAAATWAASAAAVCATASHNPAAACAAFHNLTLSAHIARPHRQPIGEKHLLRRARREEG